MEYLSFTWFLKGFTAVTTTKVKNLNHPGQSPEAYLYLSHRKRKGKQNVKCKQNVHCHHCCHLRSLSNFINILQLVMSKGHEYPQSERNSKIKYSSYLSSNCTKSNISLLLSILSDYRKSYNKIIYHVVTRFHWI